MSSDARIVYEEGWLLPTNLRVGFVAKDILAISAVQDRTDV
jgi:hypothetical protein